MVAQFQSVLSLTYLQERVYDVGSHCGSRVHLYHSLWHYKRRLCGQLKKELKAARLFLEVISHVLALGCLKCLPCLGDLTRTWTMHNSPFVQLAKLRHKATS